MSRGNLQTRNLAPEESTDSLWPGKAGNSNTFAKDIPGRWYPTSWGAGCGPDLSDYNSESSIPQSEVKCHSGRRPVLVPSFEIGTLCPNCGIAKMKLDADEHVSCPLCLFGAICDCSD